MKKIIIAVLFLLAGTAGAQVVSKRGTTAAPFLSIGQGARAIAMGGAFVAVANDVSSMYWNPAGIADLKGIGLMFDHTQWIADIKYEYLGATINLGPYGGLGVNVTASNIGDMAVTTVDQQDGTGEVFSVSDLAVGITYGLRLTEDFSIGFNPKLVYQKIWKMSASAIAVDVGVKYRTPFDGVTLGMSISNFGGRMQMVGPNSLILYDPDPTTSGHNARVPANLSTDEWDLPLTYRVGLAYDLPVAGIGTMIVAVDALHPSDDYESLNVGGEFVFKETFYVRGGMKSMFQKDSEEGFTLGVGVAQALIGNMRFRIDYAYQDFSRLKNTQKISLGVTF